MLSTGFASVLAVSLITSGGPAHAEEARTLADLMRPDFEFVDANKDEVVTMEELKQLNLEVSEEEAVEGASEEQLSFTLRLFDLNQDRTLTDDEMLTSMGLDALVGEDLVDEDAIKLFDPNGDGLVEREDWAGPLGDIGPQGDVLKQYVFDRVDRLYDGDGKLGKQELFNALSLIRNIVLGF